MGDKKVNVIAMDGPSGVGKSTLAKLLAQKLDYTYLDTGSMYRGVAHNLHHAGIKADDDNAIEQHLGTIDFEYAPEDGVLIRINDQDLTQEIREHDISALASLYSKSKAVREFLKDTQRAVGLKQGSILEGRDIGTVIFPDAKVKVFLTADPEVRAKRRFEQLLQKDPNAAVSLDKIKEDIIARDKQDSNRTLAPLKKADDAIEVDTSSLSIEEVVDKIADICEKKGLDND